MADSTLTVRKIASGSTSFYAAPSYLARRGRPKSPWSSDHEWIAHRVMRESWKLPAKTVRHHSDDMTLMRELAREGAGVVFLPDYLAAPYVQSGALERVELAIKSVTANIVLLYPSSGQVPRKVSAFRDFLVEHLASSPLG